MQRGSCLCGAVRFKAEGALLPPDACHCVQCRKHSGHFFVSTDVRRAALNWIGVAMGAFELPTDTRIKEHIFVAEKGDYYELADGAPQHLRTPAGAAGGSAPGDARVGVDA